MSPLFRRRGTAFSPGPRGIGVGVEILEDRTLLSADINNGIVRLGINDYGGLSTPAVQAPIRSAGNLTNLGMRYMPTNVDADAGGGPEEGWGVADTIVNQWGGIRGGTGITNLTMGSFSSTAGTATSTVTAAGIFQVSHDYHPSTNPNVYEITVTITNLSAATVNARYRRAFGWDIEPVVSNEYLTIQGSTHLGVFTFYNSGGGGANNPLGGSSVNNDVVNFGTGASDVGFSWGNSLGLLAPGASVTFNTYYGAAADRTAAEAAITALGADGYALVSNGATAPTDGSPNTFLFGYKYTGLPAGVTITPTGGATDVTEGGATDTFTVVLNSEPAGNVTLSLTPNSQLSVVPTRVFTPLNWFTPQTITVSAVNDLIAEGLHNGAISFTTTSTDTFYNGLALPALTANITDNDTASLTLGGAAGTLAEGASTTSTHTVRLSTPPQNNVVITPSGGTQYTVAPANLTFTPGNWNVNQTLTVAVVDDALLEGDHTGTITYAAASADVPYNGPIGATLTGTIRDNDPDNFLLNRAFTLTGDYVAAGVGLLGQSSGSINLAGIPAGSTVVAAYLYWYFYAPSQLASLPSLTFAGTPLTGTLIGAKPSAQYGPLYAYRADVTSQVAGNGTYGLAGVATGGGVSDEGASLVVVYTNPTMLTRTIVIYDGANKIETGFVSSTNTFTGFTAPARVNARTTFITGESEGLGETESFVGGLSTINWSNLLTGSDGSKWDTKTVDVSSAIAPGDTSVSATMNYTGSDVIGWITQVFSIGSPGVALVQSGGSTDIAEAGPTSDTYSMALQALPSANVIITLGAGTQLTLAQSTFTFTPTNWSTPQTVTVTAVDDLVNEGAHTGVITHTATSSDVGYNGLPLASITATITDNDNVSITVAPTAGLVVGEGSATANYTVVLTLPPIANVVVTLTPDAQLGAVPTRLTFTSANWNTAQTVTLSAVDDFLTEGPHSGVLTQTVSSADPRYNGFALAAITASISDNDTAGVTLLQSGGATSVTEGAATDTYTVVLNTSPSASVFITLSPGTQLSVPSPVLTFTAGNWSVVQTVTVSAVNDAIFEGPHTGVVTHTVSSGDPGYNSAPVPNVTASITDDDAVGVLQSGGSTDVSEAGLIDSYTLVLNSMPTANVVITLSPASTLNVVPALLTFTPAAWNIAQTVSLGAINDLIYQGPHTGLVQHTVSSTDTNYNGVFVATVTANIADNDSAGVTVTPLSFAFTEGGPGSSHTIVLTSQPTADVLITLTGSSLTPAAPLLTFTPTTWNIVQTVSFSVVDDVLAQGLHNGTITHTASSADAIYNGFAIPSVTASIIDDDVPGVTLSSGSLALLEGSTRTYTAVLDLPPVADVVVNFTPGSLLAIAPATLTFTPANWNIPQPAVITAIDDSLMQGIHADNISHTVFSGDPAYNGLVVPALTASILDNEGTVIQGTPNVDRIVVTNSIDLATVNVSVNGKVTSYPSTLSQIFITTLGGADNVQLFNPVVPVILLGGQGTDSVLIAGRAGSNAFTIGDATISANGVDVSLFEVETVVAAGSSADDTFTVAATPLFNVECRANQGSDLLIGSDRPNSWKILNPNYGTLNTNIRFTGVENLTGGASTDGFYFSAGKSVAGQIDGAAGANVLNYSLYTTAVIVNLQTGKATGVSNFQNIDQVVGGKNASDRLIGLDQANTWNITDWNAGNVNGVIFQNIENVTGGQSNDTFRLADKRGLKGKIDGSGGLDVLDYSGFLSRAVSINLQLHLATNVAGFTNVEQVAGGSGSDTLIGTNTSNVWTLTASNAGDINGLAFSGFENLTGGLKNDSFLLNAGADWTGLLDGGAGSDSLVAPGGAYVATGPGAGLLNGRRFRGVERTS